MAKRVTVRSVAAAAFLVIALSMACNTVQAVGVQLYGAGSPNIASVFDAWNSAYLFSRDDVGVSYSGSGITPAFAAYSQGNADFLVMDRGLSPELSAQYGGLAQLPLVGQAIVMAYNITALNSTDPNIVVDRETLSLIWLGNVTRWNDQRIKDRNPAIANKLPNAPIIIGYNENTAISLVEVLKLALESFSPDFKAALAAANRTWAGMPPAQRVSAGSSTAARLNWLQANDNSMTFLSYADTVSSPFKWMNMINKAGRRVQPSVESVQSAMADFGEEYGASNFTIDIVDAPGNESWPITYMSYLSVKQNVTTFDCTSIQELLAFVAWVQTNDAASQEAITLNVAPLDVSLRRRLVSLLSTVQCNGRKAYSTSYLIGLGAPSSLFTSWGVGWSSLETRMKYFQSTSNNARQEVSTYDADFGVVNDGLSAAWLSRMSDAALMPMAAYAIAPGYYVPELEDLELVLDFESIALIYLNEITAWNDSRIQALNSPEVAAALPGEPIKVITQSIATGVTTLFTTVLSERVPAFAAQVGAGSLVSFPVESADGGRSIVVTTDVLPALRTTMYSFAFWSANEIYQTQQVKTALMKNVAGTVVRASEETVLSALLDLPADVTIDYDSLLLGEGENSWPVTTFASVIYRQSSMAECDSASALAAFLYWTQTAQRYVLSTENEAFKARFLNQLKGFTCKGVQVSKVAKCISEGKLCSNAGTCIDNACQCASGREGQFCENAVGTSSDNALVIILVLIVVLLVVIKRKGNKSDDWEINYDELEIGEQLGAGGYGEVYKATWKGTEVAVKVMASEKITKEMEKSFKDEVRVMTALRHPNVVLFMAASTKAPKMCIVMEFMALGSLYDLLHNELIPEIPFALKAKMAYQASKGMHFLHSSGIVHRDLKSLNLLLDSKWNVKVSDFGLTKFKEDVNTKDMNTGKEVAGSVHWTAPEVLNESLDVDFILADVYSFGIILWELLTREQPYFGLSPAAVAVSVIRDGIRPTMPADTSLMHPAEYEELITSCWHTDPTIRPTFLEIMTRLSAMHGDSNTSAGGTSTSHTSSSSGHSGGKKAPASMYGSWTLPSSAGSTGTSSSSNSSTSQAAAAGATTGGVRPPEGEVTIVFTDITRAASLWEFNAAAMRDATLLHNETLRAALKKHRGYEVVFIRDRNSGEGSFCMAFQSAGDAVAWCSEVQQALLRVEWPEALLEHPGAAEEWGDTDDRVLYKGLRVRMGMHVGTPRVVRDPMTRRVEYIGSVVNAAARITAMTHGGQVVLSHTVYDKVKGGMGGEQQQQEGQEQKPHTLVSLGKFEIPDAPLGARLYELKVDGLEGRFFGGVTRDSDNASSDHPSSNNKSADASGASSSSGRGHRGDEVQTAVGEGMMFKEDTFLTSANLCRWIIDFGEIQVGKQIGLGSYGVVYRGKWKGVEVAVKRFIKQKLDERRMLEFRAEMAFLSELHHPNIVLFIGACVKKPNLCIVTEFMKQGSLKDILGDNGVKLTWKQKLRLLRSAALGINYLHSLHPVIVHRDLKPSNLLVDENWNVKVADFGFARIKEENATMTRCGTPCWTAPEILRGEKYDERADVFSFGVVMWQVLTRREPFAGRNFMGVSLDVLEGKRPQIPNDCPAEFKKVMKKCWHASAEKRPTMEAVVVFLEQQVGDDPDALGL